MPTGALIWMFDMAAYFGRGNTRHWDVSPDGQRVLAIRQSGAAATSPDGQREIILVQNWFEELKRLVPVD